MASCALAAFGARSAPLRKIVGHVLAGGLQNPDTAVAASETIRPPIPRSFVPTELTTTCKAIASPADAAKTTA